MASRMRQIACDVFIAYWESLATGVGQKLSKAPGKKQAFRQAFWACNKRTNRRISKPSVADNQ
jgi:long-subunit acyl-CoA synthetase (AMP-forming)